MSQKEAESPANNPVMRGYSMSFAAGYWWRVLSTALIASAELVGWKHPAKWPVGIVLFAAPLAALAYFAPEQFKSRITLVAVGLAVSVTMFALLMLWNVISEIPRRAFEAEQLAAKHVQGLTAEIEQLKAAKLSEAEKEQRRAKLNDLISGGDVLLRNIQRQNDAKFVEQLTESCKPWLADCESFVLTVAPTFISRYRSDAGLDNGTMLAGPLGRARLYNFVERRVIRLGELSNKI